MANANLRLCRLRQLQPIEVVNRKNAYENANVDSVTVRRNWVDVIISMAGSSALPATKLLFLVPVPQVPCKEFSLPLAFQGGQLEVCTAAMWVGESSAFFGTDPVTESFVRSRKVTWNVPTWSCKCTTAMK
jgi:hypothetical protein